MKKLFKAIRHGDIDEVKAILEKNPEAISSIAAPPPKKIWDSLRFKWRLRCPSMRLLNILSNRAQM
ncbi:MAG: hypothetical protein HDT42_13330 [Ruminococcaceae bacterium]|nr:hypothetical protein [Oscillospiraceae bacterium]